MMILAQRIEEKDAMAGTKSVVTQRTNVNWSSRPALGNRNGSGNANGAGRNGPSTGAQQPLTQTDDPNRNQNSVTNGGSAVGQNFGRDTQVQGGAGANGGRGPRNRRLSPEEWSDYRRRNLCFRCDGPYSPDHVCPSAQINVVLLGDGIGLSEPEFEREEEFLAGGDEGLVHLSMHSVIGMTSNQSLKLWGTVKGKRVVVLIDTGASHNFMAEEIAEQLHLPIDRLTRLSVVVGDGHRIKSPGCCREVVLDLPGCSLVQNLFLFNMSGVDVILGFEWLQELGNIQANFKELSLKTPWQGKTIEIKGDPLLSCSRVSYKGLGRTWRKGVEKYYVELSWVEGEGEDKPQLPASIREVLEEFKGVFEPITELPPKRDCDHKIVMKEGSEIPNIKPYRYPHYQKDEIEKFVKEMTSS